MLKTLALKELRETAGIAVVALAVYFYIVASAMNVNLQRAISMLPGLGRLTRYWMLYPGQEYAIPFVGGGFQSNFTFISVCLAIALGFRQSVGESVRGTYPFLLHRPMGRQRLLGTKLAVGAVVCLVCSAVPVLVYAWWAATPGTHASPFEWSMTVPTWKVWISVPILYLGAFLSGIRSARWKGTRLVPLAATGVLAMTIPHLPWWSICGLGAVVLVDVLLVYSIFFAARTRDY
ncbi:MAG: hypothetical protein ABIP48_25040 [Planctomycetota bacterium]